MPVSTSDVLRSPRAAGDKCRGRTMFFYDDGDELAEVFKAQEVLREAVDYMESTGNEEAEVRYDGIKYFIVEAVY